VGDLQWGRAAECVPVPLVVTTLPKVVEAIVSRSDPRPSSLLLGRGFEELPRVESGGARRSCLESMSVNEAITLKRARAHQRTMIPSAEVADACHLAIADMRANID
jgi:hypothetical protein